jgi:hypothetical protein
LFLLETKEFNKFQTVLTHARRVLDAADIQSLAKLQGEFQKALGVTEAQPGGSVTLELGGQSEKKPSNPAISSALKSIFKKKIMGKPAHTLKFQTGGIEEEENEEDDA